MVLVWRILYKTITMHERFLLKFIVGYLLMGFPGSSLVKNQLANGGDEGSTPGLGRSPGEGNGNPLQCSSLENPKDKEPWWATVHGVAKQLDMTEHAHTYIHKRINKILLYSTGNYIQYSVINHSEKEYICIYTHNWIIFMYNRN